MTLWESMDAMKSFAGSAPEKAKQCPQDDRYLLEKEAKSQVFEVFHRA